MRYVALFTGILFLLIKACTTAPDSDVFDQKNLVAWCIVPFDAKERTPEQRVYMLKDLGIQALAYDYRTEHIPSFPEEIELLEKHGIRLHAVWLWVDPRQEDLPGEEGRIILEMLKESRSQTEIWLGMPDNAFDGLSGAQSLDLAVRAIGAILEQAEAMGCNLALYNHGGWYGEPANLVRMAEAVDPEQIKIVYNFHHGHQQVEDFEQNLELMLPFLSTINLNGMKVEGPKIITLGEGEHELEMMQKIQDSGFSGSIGILGHTEGEDIRKVLERNLLGLKELKEEL
jgi:hypothetical protein